MIFRVLWRWTLKYSRFLLGSLDIAVACAIFWFLWTMSDDRETNNIITMLYLWLSIFVTTFWFMVRYMTNIIPILLPIYALNFIFKRYKETAEEIIEEDMKRAAQAGDISSVEHDDER